MPELLDLYLSSSIIVLHPSIDWETPGITCKAAKGKGEDGAMTEDQSANHGPLVRAFMTLGEFLEADGWHPQRMGDKTIYRTGFSGENRQVVCFAQVRSDLEQFMVYAMAPVKATGETRQAAAEYIPRANYGLRIGNSEMDFHDGEVRYRSSMGFEGVGLSPKLIQHVIYPALQTMDRYLPGLMRVIYGRASPEEAIGDIEQ